MWDQHTDLFMLLALFIAGDGALCFRYILEVNAQVLHALLKSAGSPVGEMLSKGCIGKLIN